MSRTAEMVLGILGGIFGILAVIFVIGATGFFESLGVAESSEASAMYSYGGTGLLFGLYWDNRSSNCQQK